MKRYYVSAPVDEVRLAQAVQPSVHALAGRVPSEAELRERTRTHGVDHATMELLHAIRAAPTHRRFIDAVDAQRVHTCHEAVGDKVVFIPALLHGHAPETGADAAFIAGVARTCGFQVDTVPVRSAGTVSHNAGLIAEHLHKETAERVWVFSMSKGSADFRLFLQRHADHPVIARLAGWINACGMPAGCEIADHDRATPLRRLKYWTRCAMAGTSPALLHELSTSHPHWQQPLQLPAGLQVLNFMALPLGSHIQTSLAGRYAAISGLGPNDGMVTCRRSVVDGGLIYPVWGCDHFFRGPQIMTLLYRFFTWLRDPARTSA